MHPQQLIGLGKLTYSSIKDTSPYSFAIFGVNYAHRGINRRLLRYGGEDIRPDVFGIEVTNYCSRVCEGCYVPEEIRNDMEVIDEHLLLSSISQAKKFGIRNFGFLGGEPMNKHTIPLTLKAVSKNPLLSFVYCTNGDYIAKNDVSYFQKHNNVGFLLSLDGFEDMNDSIRGKNAYSNVMDASKQLSSLRKIISASVTVRDNNIDEVFSDDFINHLIDNGFKYVVWIKYKHNGS